MKKFLVLCMCFSFLAVYAEAPADSIAPQQKIENSPNVKALKKARDKRIKQINDSIDNLDAVQAMRDGFFVIQADRIMFGNSGALYQTPEHSTNFVLVQGDHGILQVAFNNGTLGYNGLGGITVDGSVSHVKIKVDKHGNTRMTYSIMGPAISAQVEITLYAGSSQAMAFITPNFNANNITVYGELFPYKSGDPTINQTLRYDKKKK